VPWRPSTTRALQIATVGLLAICVAQVAYWVIEESTYTDDVQTQVLEGYTADAAAVQLALDAGRDVDDLLQTFPHLIVVGGRAYVSPAAIDVLTSQRARRMNRYRWEGSFFLLVLLGGIAVVTQALRQRSELIRRQENFIAAVSHEFKSPLASLKLSAETLLLRETDAPAVERVATRMVQDVDRLEAMVANTLDASRIDEGRLKLVAEAIELQPALQAVLDSLEYRIHGRGVAVSSELEAGLVVQADRVALSTVLRNLVHNAIKSVDAGGGGRVEIHARAAGRQVRIDVVDDGLGFEASETPRLFEKFYRSGDEMRRRTKGSGLGLYIARRLVEADGGRLDAQSDGPGRGATFSVRWPRARGGEA